MSNETSESPRGDGQRRRSRGGRNRNRNRRNNQDGSPRNDNRDGGREGNREGGGRGQRSGNRSGGQKRTRERRQPKPVPLTWWQKLLKSIGLYKEPVRPPRSSKAEPKSNTRVAKSSAGPEASDEPKARGERKPRRDRKERKDSDHNDERRDRRPPENVVVESNRLYLGNLSYEASENDIEELFKGIGNVRRVEIVYNRQTHRSKGYGFIDMMNKDEAKRAVEILHDQFFMGRRLVVNGAKSQGPADGEEENDDPTPEPEAEAAEATPITIEETPVAEAEGEELKP
jgi:hypothetical protein